MREAFAEQLAELEQRIADGLGSAVLALADVAQAVSDRSAAKSEAIAQAGQLLRSTSRGIDADLVVITARQAPVASDLRLLLSAANWDCVASWSPAASNGLEITPSTSPNRPRSSSRQSSASSRTLHIQSPSADRRHAPILGQLMLAALADPLGIIRRAQERGPSARTRPLGLASRVPPDVGTRRIARRTPLERGACGRPHLASSANSGIGSRRAGRPVVVPLFTIGTVGLGTQISRGTQKGAWA